MKKKEPFLVVRDSGEKKGHGWTFEPSAECLGTEVRNLYTADYTLAGWEDVFAVERKGCCAEFAGNLTQKDKWDDFRQELERLDAFAAPFVVLEFPFKELRHFPHRSALPPCVKKRIRVTGDFLLKRLMEVQLQYRAKFVTTDGCGREAFLSLAKRVVERWPRERSAGPA